MAISKIIIDASKCIIETEIALEGKQVPGFYKAIWYILWEVAAAVSKKDTGVNYFSDMMQIVADWAQEMYDKRLWIDQDDKDTGPAAGPEN